MYVVDAFGGGFLQHLFDDHRPDVRPLHRWQWYREVVEGDGELHAGLKKLVQRLHGKRIEQRPFDGDVRVCERLQGSGGVDDSRSLRQLLVVEHVTRVEPHGRAVLLKDGRETRTAHHFIPLLASVIEDDLYVALWARRTGGGDGLPVLRQSEARTHQRFQLYLGRDAECQLEALYTLAAVLLDTVGV